MKDIIRKALDSAAGFTARHRKFIFTTLARIVAALCFGVAALFAWKLSGQI